MGHLYGLKVIEMAGLGLRRFGAEDVETLLANGAVQAG